MKDVLILVMLVAQTLGWTIYLTKCILGKDN